MTKEQLYESIGQLDDKILENSERQERKPQKLWKWLALAACFALIVVLIARFSGSVYEPAADDLAVADMPDTAATEFFYNDAEENWVLSDEPYGRFSEELGGAELAAVLPKNMPDWMDCTAYARFSKEGELIYVELQVATTNPDLKVWITLGDECHNSLEYTGWGKPTTSQCGDVTYTLYQNQYETPEETRFMFTATARMNNHDVLFETYGNWELVEQAKADFETILASFATYPEGEPNLSVISADFEPTWYTKELTTAQAKADPDFGAYIPKSLMEETKNISLHREKSRFMDSLQSVWEREDGFINWNVSYVDPESESTLTRLVSVEDREKYDRSLYLLPWRADMQEELQRTVESPIFMAEELTLQAVQARGFNESEDRYVIEFSVIYEDIEIFIYSVNMEPEWIYEQIQNLMEQ